MTIGEKLKSQREKKGLTQEQVISKLDKEGNYINKDTLSRAETSKSISTPTLCILAKFYGVSFDYLLNDDEENTTNENINIKKILGLSDSAIDKIKQIDDKNIEIFNEFISEFPINSFLNYLEELKHYKSYIKVMAINYQIRKLKPLIIYYSENNKKEELKEIFKYFRDIWSEYYKFELNEDDILDIAPLGIYIHYLEDTYLYKDLKIRYYKDSYINDTIQKKMDDLCNSMDEDTKKIYADYRSDEDLKSTEHFLTNSKKRISYLEYEISNTLNHYLSKIENFDNLSELENVSTTDQIKEFLKTQNNIKNIKKGKK